MQETKKSANETGLKERGLFGTLGAVSFSLIGVIVYFLIGRLIGALPAAVVGGYVLAALALKGYSLATQTKNSKTAIKISMAVSCVMLAAVWYGSFCYDTFLTITQLYPEEHVTFSIILAQGPFYLVKAPLTLLYLMAALLMAMFACSRELIGKKSRKNPQKEEEKPKPKSLHHIDD